MGGLYKKVSQIAVAFFSACVLVLPQVVFAASLHLSPSNTTVKVGDTFTIKVLVNTQNKFINNAEAILHFPSNLLEVVSLSAKASVFGLWVEQPTFSNSAVSFNGGVVNPGYNGSGGELLAVQFKAKQSGSAAITFSDTAVRENDGLGTNVLTGSNGANIEVVDDNNIAQEVKAAELPKASSGSFARLVVSSPTYPDQTAWYNNNDGIFTWKNPVGVQSLRTQMSDSEGAVPTKVTSASAERKEVPDIEDGISYFNIRYLSTGGWSKVSSYKVQIDTVPPNNLRLSATANADGTTNIEYGAHDALSGLVKYTLSVDNKNQVTLPADSSMPAIFNINPGLHTAVLAAFDKAGNTAEYHTTFTTLATVAPEISKYSNPVPYGDSILARGHTVYYGANITVSLKSLYGEVTNYDVESNEKGDFVFKSAPLSEAGEYELWAAVLNADGTNGPASERVKVQVAEAVPLIVQISNYLFSPITILLLIILILAALAGIGWYKFFIIRMQYAQLKKQIERENPKPTIQSARKSLKAPPAKMVLKSIRPTNDQIRLKINKMVNVLPSNERSYRILNELDSLADQYNDHSIRELYIFNELTEKFEWNEAYFRR